MLQSSGRRSSSARTVSFVCTAWLPCQVVYRCPAIRDSCECLANDLAVQRPGSERKRGPGPLQRRVRQPRSQKHEPHMGVVGDDLLEDVKERLTLASLSLRQTGLDVGNVGRVAGAEVLS